MASWFSGLRKYHSRTLLQAYKRRESCSDYMPWQLPMFTLLLYHIFFNLSTTLFFSSRTFRNLSRALRFLSLTRFSSLRANANTRHTTSEMEASSNRSLHSSSSFATSSRTLIVLYLTLCFLCCGSGVLNRLLTVYGRVGVI